MNGMRAGLRNTMTAAAITGISAYRGDFVARASACRGELQLAG
jgi:hypothetical protein